MLECGIRTGEMHGMKFLHLLQCHCLHWEKNVDITLSWILLQKCL